MRDGYSLGMEVRAELLPEDRQRVVRELQAVGSVLVKVGEGINDAPARPWNRSPLPNVSQMFRYTA
ncbi:hypothetical protein JP75_05210 [Devosia riboflavina]|uniref:Uncharacterized protein n=1 Tax=Devosia riboflavina TaxID=46914 RepID=A0A087M640_9HYPH|nr:hypothetical protein JP75_05210 [Devosia riboflavina]